MPFAVRPCGTKIHYAVKGAGAPVLLLAPGGMRSCIAAWQAQPYDPWSRLAALSFFKVIAMDQRCGAGASEGPLPTNGWDTFRDDQLAVLDAAGVDAQTPCLLVGSCIGPSYIINLLKAAPHRFTAAVLMQPIGLAEHSTEPVGWPGLNTFASQHWFGDWANGRISSGLNQREE